MPERRLPVDVEAAILGGDHGVLQFGGKSRERDPLRVFCIRPAGPDRHMATRRHAADVIAAAAVRRKTESNSRRQRFGPFATFRWYKLAAV